MQCNNDNVERKDEDNLGRELFSTYTYFAAMVWQQRPTLAQEILTTGRGARDLSKTIEKMPLARLEIVDGSDSKGCTD